MYVTYTRIYGWSDYGGESSYQPGYRLENMMWMTLLVYDYIIPGEYIYTAPPGTYFEDSSLNDAFLLFLKVRQNNGDSLTKEQVQLLREELLSMSDKPEELTAIVKKSAMNGWKSFYPLKKGRTKKAEAKNILLIRCLQGIRNSKCRKCKTVVI